MHMEEDANDCVAAPIAPVATGDNFADASLSKHTPIDQYEHAPMSPPQKNG